MDDAVLLSRIDRKRLARKLNDWNELGAREVKEDGQGSFRSKGLCQ
jgi:hypothetical protein